MPGLKDVQDDEEKVVGTAEKIIDAVINEAGTFIEEPGYSEVKEGVAKVVKELVRAAGSELHNIASLAGGILAQEVIKVITRQYVPIDNTCLFDGINSKSAVVRI
ncbi:hypothetical protein LTR28_010844 [Elasticomyces elasticus]|nr:hypothetical protein LTR28_010844 [Elasticomyces elasticus]